MNVEPHPAPRWFYTREELVRRGIKLSDSSLSRKEAQGVFPKRVKLGRFSCAWIASEIEDYVKALADARKNAPSATSGAATFGEAPRG